MKQYTKPELAVVELAPTAIIMTSQDDTCQIQGYAPDSDDSEFGP